MRLKKVLPFSNKHRWGHRGTNQTSGNIYKEYILHVKIIRKKTVSAHGTLVAFQTNIGKLEDIVLNSLQMH